MIMIVAVLAVFSILSGAATALAVKDQNFPEAVRFAAIFAALSTLTFTASILDVVTR